MLTEPKIASQPRMRRFALHPLNWLTAQRVGIILLLISIMTGVIGYATTHPDGFQLSTFLADFYANVSSETASIAITVLIIDTLNRRRERTSATLMERHQLVSQLGSGVNEVSRRASEELRDRGWLVDGTLQGVDLRTADLNDTKLWDADLQGANLQWAKLKNANLNGSNLAGANLKQANLQAARAAGADCRGANFFEAKLYRVNFKDALLQEADLRHAHLEGARLTNASLCNALLEGAHLDEKTVLPDDTHYTPETDLARFTDPQHPRYFQPQASEHRQRM
jgi:uncharacterized protein YjbI with pentapeptide repeats